MKLKTELVSHFPLMCDFNALKHDVAAAHALMQAIDEIGTRGIQDADEIANRADDIMRSWGFES